MKSLTELRNEPVQHVYYTHHSTGLIGSIAIMRHRMFINKVENIINYLKTELFNHDYIRRDCDKLPRLIKSVKD